MFNRGKQLVKLCEKVKNAELSSSASNTAKKKSNWFCNRGLSPVNFDSCTSPSTSVNSYCNEIKKPEQDNEIKKPDQDNEIKKPFKDNEINRTNKENEIKRPDEIDTIKKPDQDNKIKKPDEVNKKTELDHDNDRKKIIIHNLTIIKPNDLALKDCRDMKKKIEDKLEDSDNEFIAPSPEDPFYTSGDEDSSYKPSDEEDNLTRDIQSPVVTRAAKTKIKMPPIKIQENIITTMPLPVKTTYKRKRDYCYFCEIEVLNFARHVMRNHSTELEVAEILAKPNKSKERRQLLDKLRRKGNFLENGSKCFKAVRQSYVPGRSVLPCDNCLGYFSAKLLYRHRKKCYSNKSKGAGAQIAGLDTLIRNKQVPPLLKELVFPRMRPDKVSMEAKKDILICQFGARYLSTHREKHFVHVTSRKMRELAKILIEIRKLEPSITDLFSALKPQFFDLFVEATKRVTNYNTKNDTYMSPTFAMNIATSIKQCCDIAITFAYKRHNSYLSVTTAEAEANLKTLIKLFESNWKFDVSTQAANNLNLNRWNKVTLVPLASDLKLLRNYLLQTAEDASNKLKENMNCSVAYSSLVESVYCRVILLNRKRSGELQRMLLQPYINCSSENEQYEEFNKAVSPTEKILLKTLKRVVIRGKRGRGVPVLFSSDVQKHIEILLGVRKNFIPKENPFLFAKLNSESHILGYKILSKHAKSCGAKNPSSITSTRLRKHLATLSQLFNLSDNEIEQLATFMGHTPGVHRNSYRLPDDVYQTAKISKLLLLMEKGGADEFKGKSLDDINIDMEENLYDNQNSDESGDELTMNDKCLQKTNISIPSTSAVVAPSTVVPKKGKKRTLVPWTSEQKSVVKTFFKNNIKLRKPPKKSECEELKSKHSDLLENKSWVKIKVFVQNEYTKK